MKSDRLFSLTPSVAGRPNLDEHVFVERLNDRHPGAVPVADFDPFPALRDDFDLLGALASTGKRPVLCI
jgi:hypothetical protein